MKQFGYVVRARDLVSKTTRAVVLVLVPLAVALSSQASSLAILPTGSATCSYIDGGSSQSCSSGAFQIASPGNGVEGVGLYTVSPVDFFSTGAGSLTLSASGILSGSGISLGTVIPLAYDFSITSLTSGGELPVNWTLTFTLDPVAALFGTAQVSGSGIGDFNGLTSLTVSSPGGPGSPVSSIAKLSWTSVTGSGGFEISVPDNGTFDINANSAPEPATTGLLASALALFGWRSRRRR